MSGNTKVLRKCLQLTVISCLEGQQNFLDRQESSLINKKIYIIFLYIPEDPAFSTGGAHFF